MPCVVVAACPDTSGDVSIGVDQASMSGLIMVVTKEMEVINVTDNVYTMLGINMVGKDI